MFCLSRTQKCVTLSTTEAEFVEMADGVKEALHVREILAFLMPSLGRCALACTKTTMGR